MFRIYILWQPTPSPANIKTTQTPYFKFWICTCRIFLLFTVLYFWMNNFKFEMSKIKTFYFFKLMLYFIYSWSTLTKLAPTITCLIYYLRVLNIFSSKIPYFIIQFSLVCAEFIFNQYYLYQIGRHQDFHTMLTKLL